MQMIKKLGLILSLMLVAFLVKGQDYHFVYFQTANKTPFYVKINGDLLSSSETGYLIVSQLIDEEIEFSLGFIQKQWPEQAYRIKMNDRDRGLLVQFGEVGVWSLVDLQTSQAIPTADKIQVLVNRDLDEFSRVLAEVSNDPSLLKSDSQQIIKPSINQKIELVYSLLDSGYRRMTYLIKERLEGRLLRTDTVQVDLDYRAPEQEKKSAQLVDSVPFTSVDSFQLKASFDSIKTDSVPMPVDTAKKDAEVKVVKWFMACKQEADEKDFVQLRKKMAGADTELDMLDLAEKAFKKKCYRTEQVRNLSTLILQDDNRYRFFELAYPATADKSNFSLLQTLLSGQQNIERFKNLIR